MSMMTRADFEGSIVMGSVYVWMVCVGPGFGDEYVEGWVRSKPVFEECDQKFEDDPIKAFRWALRGIVEDMAAKVDNYDRFKLSTLSCIRFISKDVD
jgi:hypothetical protein